MTLDAAELNQITTLCARLVRETMSQASRGGLAVPVLRPATLLAWDAPGLIGSVVVDGDATPIDVINTLNERVPVGTRVLVHFEPPHGVFIAAVLGTPTITMPHIETVRGNATAATVAAGAGFANTPTTGLFNITKYRDDTKLWLWTATGGMYITGAFGHISFGLRINGVDYTTSDTSFSQLSIRMDGSGHNVVTGLASGAYTVQMRWAASGGTGNVDTETVFHAMVMETS